MADVTVKSSFQSTISDTGDTTRYGPTAHNKAMLFTGGTNGDLCVFDSTSATGAAWSAGPSLTKVLLADGTALLPSMAFASEPTLGIWRSGAAELKVQGNFATSLQILSGTSVNATTTFLGNATGTGLNLNIGNGLANFLKLGGVIGVGLDFATDAVFKIRTRAQSGYATVDALGYAVSGTPGVAAFGPAHPASITIVNGLVTAVS